MEILRICPETASDKALCDEAFIIAKNPNYGQYQCGLASMVYTFFDKSFHVVV